MHVKIRKRIGNPTLYNAKINYSHAFITIKRYLPVISEQIIILFINFVNNLIKKNKNDDQEKRWI